MNLNGKFNTSSLKMKKFFAVFSMFLILLFAVFLISGVIADRIEYKEAATMSVAKSWANEQKISAPVLSYKDGKNYYDCDLNNYNADIKIMTEIRKKGIFKIPVYVADVKLSGDFVAPVNKNIKVADFAFSVRDSSGFIDEPHIVISATDKRIKSGSEKVKLNITGDRIPFKIEFKIRGLNKLLLGVQGIKNNVKISGNTANPSFEGDFLPFEHEISDGGFNAAWSVPHIALSGVESPEVGVSLLVPVDNYRMAERTLKYAVLFFGLTFVTYFIFEIISKESRKIHPLQYLLLGLSILIFYLLLVSISEFLPFSLAYLISAIMIIAQISFYTYFVISKRKNISFSLIVTALLALLYIYLYILLSLQDFSLLFGSVGMFVVTAIIMFVTRNIDWYDEEHI